jgi:hypothetical protein
LRAAAVGQNENVAGLGDPKRRMKHEIVAGKIEGRDGLATHSRGRKECAHLRLHQALPPDDRAQSFMQIGDVDTLGAFDEGGVEPGNFLVYDRLHAGFLSLLSLVGLARP